jgi:hypothetical protein
MSSGETSYRLMRFRSSRDPDFAAALLLYLRNTQAPVRTDTNEIAYWLDTFAKKFGTPFYAFGFYRDGQLVGYAEGAYLRDERLVVLDYLVIDEVHRRSNVFFELVDHLKRYIESEHPDYRYATVEAGYGPGQKTPTQESVLLTRLLKIQGFRVVRAPYYQPRLSLGDAENEMAGNFALCDDHPGQHQRGDIPRNHSRDLLPLLPPLEERCTLRSGRVQGAPRRALRADHA